MKKFMTSLVMLSMIFTINAQESKVLTSKNGLPVLPEKGDFSFGINAESLLSIFKNEVSPPSFDFITGSEFIFKYFLNDRSALRSIFRIGALSLKAGDEEFKNYVRSTEASIILGAGYEKRLGSSRVQGFYGFDGGIVFEKQSAKDDNNISTRDEKGTGLMLRLNIGSEYFIAPKLSLGGQFRWGLTYLSATDMQNDTKVKITSLDLDNFRGAIMLNFYF